MNARDDLPHDTTVPGAASPAARLVHHAARRAPPELAERLEEEWTAHLAEQDGIAGRLRFALGCCWATAVISHEPVLYGAQLSAAGHGHAGPIDPLQSSSVPRRAAVLLIIVSLHLATALAFIYAVRVRDRPIPPPNMTGIIYDVPKPTTPPVPVPRPQFNHDAIRIPVPLFNPPPSSFADATQLIVQPAPSLPAAGAGPVRIAGGIGAGFPDAGDFYPASAVRLSEEGRAAVHVCVDERGRLTQDPKIAVSSGSSRLDGGALALARAGSGHYRSATENGRAVSACFQIGVRFALKN